MREIGGYFELELPREAELSRNREYHEFAVKLNTGRNAFEYLLLAQNIKKVYVPYYICETLLEPIYKHGINYQFYNINENFEIIDNLKPVKGEKILYVNYFSFKEDYIKDIRDNYGEEKLIIDNTQAFYSCFNGIDSFYSPRKFFGVSDGSYLYTKKPINEVFETDSSSERLTHLIGRIEKNASHFYDAYQDNERALSGQKIKYISPFSRKILESIDYTKIALQRKSNFSSLHSFLEERNLLKFTQKEVPFIYPLLIKNGQHLKKQLIRKKIYVPTYWSEALERNGINEFEENLIKNLVCLPIDQRLDDDDMKYIINIIIGTI